MRACHLSAAALCSALLLPSSCYAYVSPLTDELGIASEAQGTPWSSRNIRFTKRIGVKAGQTVRVDTFYSLAQDCSQSGWPQMQVRFVPVAGQIRDQHGVGTPGVPKSDIRHLCDGSEHLGDVVFYRAPEGFHGHDHFTVWKIFPDSRGAQKAVDVEVRRDAGLMRALDSPAPSR